jgi:hypothetical protein
MVFKSIIVILFIGMLISLFSALRFLGKDLGDPKRRVLNSLRLRVTMAVLLVATIIVGAYTGQLGNQAPWDEKLKAESKKASTSQKADP